ncbi:MAG: hypothetical protein HY606_11310 [Planctomycetes bacterium]|nr:hypothetical protein [Planctomycetota bacterium]
MKKLVRCVIVLALILMFLSEDADLFPQSQGLSSWAKTYVFDLPLNPSTGSAVAMEMLTDGGFVMVGYEQVAGLAVSKLDPNGNLVWARRYNIGPVYAYNLKIRQTPVGNFAIAATVTTLFGAPDIFVMLIDANGISLWSNRYGDGLTQILKDINNAYGGGFIITGSATTPNAPNGDILFMKLGSSGNIEWQKVYGTPFQELGVAMKVFGNVLVAAAQKVFFTNTFVVMFISLLDGSIMDATEYSVPGVNSMLKSMYATAGEVILSGVSSYSSGGQPYFAPFLISVGVSGYIRWQRFYHSATDAAITPADIKGIDGGVLMAGTSFNSSSNENGWLGAFYNFGDIFFQRSYCTAGEDSLNYINQTSDGGFLAGGFMHYLGGKRLFAMKLDATGNVNFAPNTMSISSTYFNESWHYFTGTLATFSMECISFPVTSVTVVMTIPVITVVNLAQ